MAKKKRKRVDGQITGLSGELFVAAELLKRGIQASITFGNAKAIDLLAYNPDTEQSFIVQVKALRKKNFFLIGHAKVNPGHSYVFVLLNAPGVHTQFYIVPGRDLHSEPELFSKYFSDEKMPGIHPNVLDALGYENAWGHFSGETTFGDLFWPKPVQWGLRGDRYLWFELQAWFRKQPPPARSADVRDAITSKITDLIGHSLDEGLESVYVDRYDQGGMSSGHVDPEFWINKAIPLIESRYLALPSHQDGE